MFARSQQRYTHQVFLCVHVPIPDYSVFFSKSFYTLLSQERVMVRVVSVVLLCLVFLGLCTLPQAQQYLSEGTAFSFDERPSIDYALVIDKSGSMRVGNRFLEAQTAASEFANQLSQGDRAAVIAFDSRAHLYESFTSDSQVLTQAIEGMVIGDWTQYQAGLYRALEEFETRTTNGQGIIVFMSDGRPDDDPRVPIRYRY